MKKRARYILSLIVSLVLTASLWLPISALQSDTYGLEQLIEVKNSSYSQYTQQIEAIMQGLVAQKELYNSSSEKDLQGTPDYVSTYDLKNAYRVFITENLFLTELSERGSFADTLTDKIQWKVPVVTQKGENGLVTLLEENGALSWVATEVGETTENLYLSDSEIKNAVQKAKDVKGGFKDMKIAHSYTYYTTFVYLSSDSEEYLIPFSCLSKDIGINNGELYTVSQIQEKFNKCFDEKLVNGELNGGVPFKNQSYIVYLLVAACCLVGTTALIVVIKRRKS